MSISNTNFLQPSGFRIVINRERFPNLQYFVQSVSHPSVSLIPASSSYSRLASLEQIGEKLEFGEVSFNIMLDEKMSAYTEMYEWMQRLTEENYTSATSETNDQLSSEHDITLLILNSSNTQEKKITFINAFPTNLGEIQLESTISEPQPISVNVSFKYTYFKLD